MKTIVTIVLMLLAFGSEGQIVSLSPLYVGPKTHQKPDAPKMVLVYPDGDIKVFSLERDEPQELVHGLNCGLPGCLVANTPDPMWVPWPKSDDTKKDTVKAGKYQGSWDPATNSPKIQNGIGEKGQYYMIGASSSFIKYDGERWILVPQDPKDETIASTLEDRR